MAKKTFPITFEGRHTTLKIEQGMMGRNVVVSLGKREIAHFRKVRDLLGGQVLKTPIGDISVEYKGAVLGLSSGGYSVWYDGRLLEGSVDHPVRIWRAGYGTALFLGVLNILLGLYVMTNKNSPLSNMFVGPLTFGIGMVTLILGLVAWRARNGIPLIVAALIFGGDGILTLIASLTAGIPPNIIGLMVRVAFVMQLWRGGTAAQDLDMSAYSLEKPKHREKVKNSY